MMAPVFSADGKSAERSALRPLFLDLKLDVMGEGADRATKLDQAPVNHTEMLLGRLGFSPELVHDGSGRTPNGPALLIQISKLPLDPVHKQRIYTSDD